MIYFILGFLSALALCFVAMLWYVMYTGVKQKPAKDELPTGESPPLRDDVALLFKQWESQPAFLPDPSLREGPVASNMGTSDQPQFYCNRCGTRMADSSTLRAQGCLKCGYGADMGGAGESVECMGCDGTGGSGAYTCARCGGRGRIIVSARGQA